MFTKGIMRSILLKQRYKEIVKIYNIDYCSCDFSIDSEELNMHK